MSVVEAPDLFSAEFLSDPYPTFAQLRVRAPVHWAEDLGVYVVTRYDDCVAILTNTEQFGPVPDLEPRRGVAEHVQYRNIVARAFTVEFVAQLEPTIQAIVDRLIDAFVSRGHVDLMSEFAEPLPTLVLAAMLGIPEAEHEMFFAWADVYTGSLAGPLDTDSQARFRQTIRDLVGYFAYRLEQRRGGTGEDLITRLAAARLGESKLSTGQLLSLCEQFMVAGRDLSTGLVANGMRALLGHPEQLQRLRDTPSLLEASIEETLRWDTPVLGQPRTNRAEFEMRGVRIKSGALVVVMFAAANRDPAVFTEPDKFDIDRANAAMHLAFGRGVHFCLGAPLARLEARVAMRTLFARLPELKLAPEHPPTRRVAAFMLNLRTFGSLPILFEPQQRGS